MNKSILNIIPKKYIWFGFIRIFSFLVIGFETFFGPKIVGLDAYGVIEYEKQIINLSAIFLFGLHTGYSVIYYKLGKENNNFIFLSTGLTHILFIFIILSLITSTFSFGILLYLFSILLEQILKIRNKFNLAIVYKPVVSIIIILYYIILYFRSQYIISFSTDINLMYLFAFLIFLTIIYKEIGVKKVKFIFDVKKYKEYLKKGFQPNLTSSLILLLFFLDRYFIEKYFNEKLGTYSIAYNFALISFLIASSIAYVTSIKIGEELGDKEKLKVKVDKFKKLSYLFILIVIVTFVPVIYLVNQYWFSNIEDFEIIVAINLLGKTIFGGLTIYSSLIYYLDKEYYSWGTLLIVNILVIVIDVLIVDRFDNSFFIIQIVSNSLLILYSLYMGYIIKNKIFK